MIQINAIGVPQYHRLTANRKIGDMKPGDMKDVLIAKYKDGRFAVMGVFFVNLIDASKCKMDFFYELMTESELHETFTEQFTTLMGFTRAAE